MISHSVYEKHNSNSTNSNTVNFVPVKMYKLSNNPTWKKSSTYSRTNKLTKKESDKWKRNSLALTPWEVKKKWTSLIIIKTNSLKYLFLMSSFILLMESLKKVACQEKIKKNHQATSISKSMKFTKSKPLRTSNKKRSNSLLMLLPKWKNIKTSFKHCTKISVKWFLKEISSRRCGQLQTQHSGPQRPVLNHQIS